MRSSRKDSWKSTRRPRRFLPAWWGILGLAVMIALAGCRGEEREAASQQPDAAAAKQEAHAMLPEATAPRQEASKPEAKQIDTPEAHAQLVNEMAESRKQALSKQEPVDPEVAKRMKDPAYRKQKDDMLNRLSQISTTYYQQGIEIRHTRKRPEWRLIDPSLARITNPSERQQKAEKLAKQFKEEVEPVLEKVIGVKVFADASESIEVY